MLIGLFGWILCGVIPGFIASKIVNLHGDDPRLGMAIGGVGGLAGGWLYCFFTGLPITSFNLMSLFFALVAALAGMAIWYLIRARGVHETPTFRRSY
jgi:uncharacterized membrane protein YeaQ/YmgE (transglycosylase-associated protein family)